jgi:hypothetical protein
MLVYSPYCLFFYEDPELCCSNLIELKCFLLSGYVYIYILVVVSVGSTSESTDTGPDIIREW